MAASSGIDSEEAWTCFCLEVKRARPALEYLCNISGEPSYLCNTQFEPMLGCTINSNVPRISSYLEAGGNNKLSDLTLKLRSQKIPPVSLSQTLTWCLSSANASHVCSLRLIRYLRLRQSLEKPLVYFSVALSKAPLHMTILRRSI